MLLFRNLVAGQVIFELNIICVDIHQTFNEFYGHGLKKIHFEKLILLN